VRVVVLRFHVTPVRALVPLALNAPREREKVRASRKLRFVLLSLDILMMIWVMLRPRLKVTSNLADV